MTLMNKMLTIFLENDEFRRKDCRNKEKGEEAHEEKNVTNMTLNCLKKFYKC